MGQCGVQFNKTGAYNEHMRDIHGVVTNLRSPVQSNLYSNPSAPLPSNPNDGAQNNLIVMTAHQSPAFRLPYMTYTLVDVLLAINTASKVTVESTKLKRKVKTNLSKQFYLSLECLQRVIT